MTETEIIKACLNQDPQGQRELVQRYSGYLYTVARRYMPDDESAKDVLQEGYIRIFKYFDKFRNEEGRLKSWMSKIVANEALRKRKKYIVLSQAEQAEAIVIKVQPEIIGLLQEEDLLEIIRDLPEMYRAVFNMYVLEGFSHKEISSELGIKPSTSRSNLARAKAILRTRITEIEINTQWKRINSKSL